MELEKVASVVADILEKKENHQKLLGQIAYEISEQYGKKFLPEFLGQVKETYGISISIMSMRNYRWSYERTKDLNIPDDISYQVIQKIAASKNPKFWADKINKEGLSSAEANRLLSIDKPKKVKTIVCPVCDNEISL